jgi:hypothetical protein
VGARPLSGDLDPLDLRVGLGGRARSRQCDRQVGRAARTLSVVVDLGC